MGLFSPPPPFESPSIPYQLVSSPLVLLTHTIHSIFLHLRGSPFPSAPVHSRIRLVCISDTHTQEPTSAIPSGDVLIHAGDMGNVGNAEEVQKQINWLNSLPHPHKLVVAGNHDTFLDPRSRYKSDEGKSVDWGEIKYLQHSSTTITFPDHSNRKLTFYGAPQIPACGGPEFAFQYERGVDAWTETIPKDIDVLITHTPPKFHLDLGGLGCEFLLSETWRVKPRVHIFGHVHCGYGRENIFWDEGQKAYEKICISGRGLLALFSVRVWLNIMRVVMFGMVGIIWTRLWGGGEEGTVMMNVAMMYKNTGKVLNPPQVIDI